MNNLQASVEAVIFAAGDPVPLDKLSMVLEISLEKLNEVIDLIQTKFEDKNSGIRLMKFKDSVQFVSKSEYVETVRKVLEINKSAPLSNAAMEVLALVAYNEPVTKAYIEQVRGVDCSGVLANLIQKELVEERGRLELPGRPLLYGTTENFLRCFGISSIEELPEIPKSDSQNTDK